MFYLGNLNKDTSLFQKNIDETIWNNLLKKCEFLEEFGSLKYYTFDTIITKNTRTGSIVLEIPKNHKVHTYYSNKYDILEIVSEKKNALIFPIQLEYFNKQRYETLVTKFNNNIVLFSKYNENGTNYFEIVSEDLDTMLQLSSSSSSS